MATNNYVPNNIKTDSEEVALSQQNIVIDRALFLCVVNGLHRIEKQLEKITGQEIDEDERNIL